MTVGIDRIKEKKHQPEQLNSLGLFRNKSIVGIMNRLAIHILTLRKFKVVLLLHFIQYNITLDANCQMPIVSLWSDDGTMHSWHSTGWFYSPKFELNLSLESAVFTHIWKNNRWHIIALNCVKRVSFCVQPVKQHRTLQGRLKNARIEHKPLESQDALLL